MWSRAYDKFQAGGEAHFANSFHRRDLTGTRDSELEPHTHFALQLLAYKTEIFLLILLLGIGLINLNLNLPRFSHPHTGIGYIQRLQMTVRTEEAVLPEITLGR